MEKQLKKHKKTRENVSSVEVPVPIMLRLCSLYLKTLYSIVINIAISTSE